MLLACDDMFYGLLAIALGDKEAAKDYSVNSFRSFLASSMLAADSAPTPRYRPRYDERQQRPSRNTSK